MTNQELTQIEAYQAAGRLLLAKIQVHIKFIEDIKKISQNHRASKSIADDAMRSYFPSNTLYNRSAEFIAILTQEEINKLQKEFDDLKYEDFKVEGEL